MDQASMIGFDIAKNVFEVHGRSAGGALVHRCSLKRGKVEKFFAEIAPAVTGWRLAARRIIGDAS